MYTWARYPKPGQPSYEVSSAGDKRFSAMWARLSDGRTIEQAYQLDVKGYREFGDDWRLGKGKPPLKEMTADELWEAYKSLWLWWACENQELVKELSQIALGKTLTDKFAKSSVSQARAWAEILSELRLAQLTGDDEFPFNFQY